MIFNLSYYPPFIDITIDIHAETIIMAVLAGDLCGGLKREMGEGFCGFIVLWRLESVLEL